MSRIDLGYSYELGSGRTRIGVMTRPRWGLGTVMTEENLTVTPAQHMDAWDGRANETG